MLPIALALAGLFLVFFFWSMRNGDIEDADMNKYRLLYDNDDDVDKSMAKGGEPVKHE